MSTQELLQAMQREGDFRITVDAENRGLRFTVRDGFYQLDVKQYLKELKIGDVKSLADKDGRACVVVANATPDDTAILQQAGLITARARKSLASDLEIRAMHDANPFGLKGNTTHRGIRLIPAKEEQQARLSELLESSGIPVERLVGTPTDVTIANITREELGALAHIGLISEEMAKIFYDKLVKAEQSGPGGKKA